MAQFLTSWLGIVKPTVGVGTWKWHEEIVRLHLVPAFGTLAIGKLSPQQVQTLYANKLNAGLSTTTVRHIHAVLHRALETAVALDLVTRNVADRAKAPRMRRHEMEALTPEQSRALLQAVAVDPLEALYVLAITTGMRQGELLGLKWRDVDLDAAWLRIRETVRKLHGEFVFTPPKTERSRRGVALTSMAVAALRRHQVRQEEAKATAGLAWQVNDFVFPDTIGGPMEGRHVLRHYFRPMLRSAGLPPIRFHDLRHTTATLLLGQGIHPKVVAEMLGHTTIGITLDTYSHVLPEMQREATRVLDRLLSPDE
jgi:integrase